MRIAREQSGPVLEAEKQRLEAEIDEEQVAHVIEVASAPIAWQPIVSLESRAVLGFEALARFASGHEVVSPMKWFTAASRFGLRDALELVAVRSACSQLARLPGDAFISLNVSPATVASPELASVLGEIDAGRVVLEIAEDAVAGADEDVEAALNLFRSRGVLIALDDTGSGLVSLRQLLGIRADIIKIDTDVVRGIDFDLTKQAIAFALKSLAERSGAFSLAEGVETDEEAEMLSSLGVEAAQGYLFGKPELLDVPKPPAAARSRRRR